MKSYKILALLEKVESLKKGDQRVLINGTPCKVNFRIISDDLFTDAVKSFKETLAELEGVKTTRDQYFKAAIHAQDKLTQAEKESNNLRKFVELFIETQQENYGNGIKTHLSMQTLADKAEQLLTPKE